MDSFEDDGGKDTIRAVARAITVLQAINRYGSLGLTQIAKMASVPYPTACRIVNTLVEEGLIEREPNRKKYRPTALIQTLSCGFQNHDRLIGLARPIISRFTHDYHWPLTVVTRVGRRMVVRDSTSTQTSLTFSNYYPGWQVPLLASASGQVYFSFADEDEQQELLLQFRNRSEPLEELVMREFASRNAQTRIREQGFAAVARTAYSANPGKTSSIAIPLFDGDKLLGSLAMVYFANAMPLSDAIARFLGPLREVSDRITEALAKSPVGSGVVTELAE